jgi:hypothetical protein
MTISTETLAEGERLLAEDRQRGYLQPRSPEYMDWLTDNAPALLTTARQSRPVVDDERIEEIITVWKPQTAGIDTAQIRMVIAEGHLVANWTVLAMCKELDYLRAELDAEQVAHLRTRAKLGEVREAAGRLGAALRPFVKWCVEGPYIGPEHMREAREALEYLKDE